MNFGSLFSGGGGADIGAMAAGLTPVFAVEYDADIAEYYRRNIGDHVTVADIRSLDPADFPDVDALHASPPCPNFSVAKTGGVETVDDIAMADAVVRFITVLRPNWFTLENVYGYRKSESYSRIMNALNRLGYWSDARHVNFADHGVPQSRKRLIVRARLGGWLRPMPAPLPHVGWYEAIEDLIDDLPDSEFAPWQLARLPDDMKTFMLHANNSQQHRVQPGWGCYDRDEPPATVVAQPFGGGPRALISNDTGTEQSLSIYSDDRPGPCVTRQHGGRLRALVGNNANATSGAPIYADGTAPAQTVRTASGGRVQRALVDGASASRPLTIRRADESAATIVGCGGRAPLRAAIGPRVVKMTPRCLARFQTFPDWYELPDKTSLACTIIGNAVPPLGYQRILEGML